MDKLMKQITGPLKLKEFIQTIRSCKVRACVSVCVYVRAPGPPHMGACGRRRRRSARPLRKSRR
jgi:hypothetical protein